MLFKRARHVNTSISLCTGSALLVCTLVAVLFTGAFLKRDASTANAALFRSAMLCLIAWSVTFMRDARDGDVAYGEALTHRKTRMRLLTHFTSPRQEISYIT